MPGAEAVNINVTSSGETTSSLIEKLGAAFTELEAQKVASMCDVRWNDVQEHLSHLESMVKKKLEELEAKKKTFSERESCNRELIVAKEAEVLSMEQDMLDKVQELKDAAVAAIAEAREKYMPETLELANGGDADGNQVNSSVENENAPLDAQEGKSPSHKEENAEVLVAEIDPSAELTQFCEQMDSKELKDAAVASIAEARETHMPETLELAHGGDTDGNQELKDAAVASIAEARETYMPETLELANGGDTDGDQV